MMTENEYIIYLFKQNFSRFKDKKIVLYGKGPVTKLIIEHFKDYNIVGIMDRGLKHGVIYGKSVLSVLDLPYHDIDIIIPVARPESIKEIFTRISGDCERYHIKLYGLNGENLFEAYANEPESLPEPDFVEIFREKFRDCWAKNIVLYGKGPRTLRLLQECPEFRFIGVMDKHLKSGEVYGKPVLDYREVLEREAEIIIVVSKEENYPFIFNRIHEFCSFNHIQLYDVEGNNLFITQHKTPFLIEENPYFDVCEEDLKGEINNHEVISFDVFDTLIMRKTLYPSDVFEIVENRGKQLGICTDGFKEYRYKIEMDVFSEGGNIYDIYNQLQKNLGLTDEQKRELLKMELRMEKNNLIRREKMVEIFKYAVQCGKPVYLVSDMYLPKDIVEDFLKNLGIIDYQKVYVSCEYKKNKNMGLFNVFKEEVRAKSYLHIGDNVYSDGLCAKEYGLDYFLIKKSIDMLQICSYGSVFAYCSNINERSIIGMFIASALNNPFCLYHSKGKPSISEGHKLGFQFVGPLITKYIIWLVAEIKKSNYDDILFCARDGYLIQRLYNKYMQIMKEEGKGIYFQISRHAAVCASMRTEEDIEWISASPHFAEPEVILHKNFDLPEEEILPYDENLYSGMLEYELAHKEKIFSNSKKLAQKYLVYMERIGLKAGKKYALWDFVASGTCHYCLSKFVPFELEGIYVCSYDSQKEEWRKLPSKAMIVRNRISNDNSYSTYACKSYFFDNYLFLESVITSFMPTLLGFSENGEPIYDNEVRGEEELRFVKDMQDGIEEFFCGFIEDYYICEKPINIMLVDRLYSFKDSDYTDIYCSVLKNLCLREDMLHVNIPLGHKK